MASHYWKYPSVLNGRIMPVNSMGVGDAVGMYYGYLGPGFGTSPYSDHVYCLGEDTESLPRARLAVGEEACVFQTNIDFGANPLMYFGWHLRTHEDMPALRTLVNNGACTIKNSGLIRTADPPVWPAADQITGFETASSSQVFTKEEKGLIVKIEGGTANDGYWCIDGIPWSLHRVNDSPVAGEVLNGQVAILSNPLISLAIGPMANATVKVLGAKWTARAYIDTSLRAELVEVPGRSWPRTMMAIHASKSTGLKTLMITLTLDVCE